MSFWNYNNYSYVSSLRRYRNTSYSFIPLLTPVQSAGSPLMSGITQTQLGFGHFAWFLAWAPFLVAFAGQSKFCSEKKLPQSPASRGVVILAANLAGLDLLIEPPHVRLSGSSHATPLQAGIYFISPFSCPFSAIFNAKNKKNVHFPDRDELKIKRGVGVSSCQKMQKKHKHRRT